ncbi:LCP family glycopolymer transferase [Nocardiopsis listeri]|uniref:LCP family glycopolymer transferase n=1 Tax=Nocardiopsis listeri TaxID=53440 RepID=UPI000833DC31|nr:LCP family protein [Nocardiopsis listeri]
MPADENSADSGVDQTPDEIPENDPVSEGRGNSEEQESPEEAETSADEPRAEDPNDEPDQAPGEDTGGESAPDGVGTPDGESAPVPADVDEPVAATEKSGEDASRSRAEDDVASDDESAESSEAERAEGTEEVTGEESTAAVTAATTGAGADEDSSNVPGASPESTPGTGGETEGATASATVTTGKKGRRRLRRVVLWTAASVAILLCLGAATAYGYYHSLRSEMTQHDIGSVLSEEDRPDKISDAVNILFIGSDGYEEDSPAYTQEFEGERSDSLMLAHISPDKRVSVISFPRDSLVQLPECDAYAKTEGTYGYFGMINAAMYHGGPPCVVRTIESLTDIRVDHFVHLSFASFRDVVDAIGGVDMCIPEPMRDERSKLDIEAGRQTLSGEEALSFVRARYDIGDGGDIGRIDRQQMFMAALADQVTSSDVLTSPRKLNGIMQAVAQHSATDHELSLDRMLSIAVTMADVDLSDIEFHTVPWYQAPYDPNRVMWHQEDADELFRAVREDRPLPELLAADDASVPQEPPMSSPTPVDRSVVEDGEAPEGEGAGGDDVTESPSARPGEGRDATSNPCQDGLGFGTGEDDW